MKKIILILLAVNGMFIPTSLAQKNVVHLEVVSDDPEDMTFFKCKLPLWELSASKSNLSIYDLNIGGIALVKDLFISVEYSMALLDRIYPDSYEGNMSSNTVSQMIMFPIFESTRANSLAVEGTYFVHKNTVTKDVKIVLAGGNNYEKYTMVKAKELQRIGVRAGFKSGFSWYAMNGATINGLGADGVTTSFGYGLMSTNVKYNRLNLGVCYSRATNLKVQTTEFGQKYNSGIDFIYGDLLLNIKTEYDDVYAATDYDGTVGTMYYTQFGINDVNAVSKIGFRFGYRYVPYKGLLGFHIEGGVAPGLKAVKNVFAMFGASFYFGKNPE